MTEQDIQLYLNIHYGIEGQISKLPGFEDINYYVESQQGKFVLKISDPPIDKEYLDFQIKLLAYLAANNKVQAPEVIKSRSQEPILYTKKTNGKMQAIRLYTWLPGKPWAKIQLKSIEAYRAYGKIIGQTTSALEKFIFPYGHRNLKWDLAQAAWIEPNIYITQQLQYIIKDILYTFYEHKTIYDKLPRQFIHNDANDYNVLTHSGIPVFMIDFGDAIYTQRINDLAIGIAYAVMGSPHPLMTAYHMVAGYHEEIQLTEPEVSLLHNLVALRLSVSLVVSYQNMLDNPDNNYLQVSAKPAEKLLEEWTKIPSQMAEMYFRHAAGFPPIKEYSSIVQHLKKNKIALNGLLQKEEKWKPKAIELDLNSSLIYEPETYHDPHEMHKVICQDRESSGHSISYGGYQECRPFYITDAFKNSGIAGEAYRTIHLGEDYWVDSGTKIIAPLSGEVVIKKNNNFYKDYGPTIVLKHLTDQQIPYYTLYGHLDEECLTRLKIGDQVVKGEWLATIGRPDKNGSWAPHLHFQIILNLLGYEDNFPGVWFPDEMNIWQYLCPDPKFLIDLPTYPFHYQKYDFSKVFQKRKKLLGPSLSLSYDEPLLLVKGKKQYLIDDRGQKYLDLVNNVAHVGHEHPRVVRVAKRQISLLNTNTRYLHPLVISCAEALLAHFSNRFTRVYFVNSGSEANELALRMAKVTTGGNVHMALDHGYHGNSNHTIDVSAYKFAGIGGTGKPANTFLLPMLDMLDHHDTSNQYYETLISQRFEEWSRSKSKLAAYIGESILSCGGQVELPKAYLRAIYQQVKANGGVCIADEVQTGFGRVGEAFWAFELYDVLPDIVTLGKPIGNGHPMGAVICTDEVAQAFNNGMEFFSTFGGNPVSCAIALEVLQVIADEKLQNHAKELGSYLKNQLIKLSHKYPIITKVSGQGLFLGIALEVGNQPAAKLAHRLVQVLRNHKVLLSTDGPDHNVIKIKPPLCITKDNVDHAVDLMDSFFSDVL